MNSRFHSVWLLTIGATFCLVGAQYSYDDSYLYASEASIVPIIRDRSSECALILRRLYASGSTLSPKYGGLYDLLDGGSSRNSRYYDEYYEDPLDQYYRYDRSTGTGNRVRSSSDFFRRDVYGADEYGRYKRSVVRKKRQVVRNKVSNELCVTYADVNAAFDLASTTKDCRGANSNPPKLMEISKVGGCILEVTKILAQQFQLSKEEITNALPLIDVTRTKLYDICPANHKPSPCTAEKFSQLDARCNNLDNPTWGISEGPFVRLLPPDHGDGLDSLRKSKSGRHLPMSRRTSSVIHSDNDRRSRRLSQMFQAFGQLIDHDMTLSAPTLINMLDFTCCGIEPEKQNENCLTIDIPTNDPFHGPSGRTCMEFKRHLVGPNSGCTLGPRANINRLTSVLDANFIYGFNKQRSDMLREFRGGRLRTALPDSHRRLGLKPILPPRTKVPDMGCIGRNRTNGLFCFEAGDPRLNENIFLIAMHTIFLREHNRLAGLLSDLNPHWNDQRLFQETRRILIATVQHINYNEYLPVVISLDLIDSFNLTLTQGFWDGYDDTVNMGAADSFMTASFRFSHSNIDDRVERFNKLHQSVVSHDLREFFRMPYLFYQAGIADELFLGLVDQAAQENDRFLGTEVRDHLFQKPSQSFGIDLAATNIHRGRSHGTPGYNEFREFCGLPRINNFNEVPFQNGTAHLLQQLFETVDDIDLWTAGIAERRLPGAMVGPTFGCLIALQFREVRRGDRFWYENPGWPSSFSLEQVREIKKITMAKLICNSGDDVETIQLFTMELSDPVRNPRYRCEDIPGIDLRYWKESGPSANRANLYYKKK